MVRSADSIIVQHLRFARFRASEVDEVDAQSDAEGKEVDEVDAPRVADMNAREADLSERGEARG